MPGPPRILAALLATAVVAGSAAAPAGASSRDKRTATRLLRGTVWTTYQSGDVTGASLDRSVTLCHDNSFAFTSSFVAPIIEDDSSYDHPFGATSITGRWRVKGAKLRHRRYGTVRVAYTTDAGERSTVVLTATRRGATLGGVPAAVSRTDAC